MNNMKNSNAILLFAIGMMIGGMYVTFRITGEIWGIKTRMTMDEYCQFIKTPASQDKE